MDSRIIASHEVLSESYIPETILHRQKELVQLSKTINVVNTSVYGPNGSGMTLLIKMTIVIFHEILFVLSTIMSSKSNYDLTKKLKTKIRRIDYGIKICLDHFDRLKEIETVNRLLSLGMRLIIVSESYEPYRRLNSMGKAKTTNIIQIPSYSDDQPFDCSIGMYSSNMFDL